MVVVFVVIYKKRKRNSFLKRQFDKKIILLELCINYFIEINKIFVDVNKWNLLIKLKDRKIINIYIYNDVYYNY